MYLKWSENACPQKISTKYTIVYQITLEQIKAHIHLYLDQENKKIIEQTDYREVGYDILKMKIKDPQLEIELRNNANKDVASQWKQEN